MFERYSERARRVIFFARYEAAQLGSDQIDTEHLLLGLLREGKGLTGKILRRHGISLPDLQRKLCESAPRPETSTAVDIPLTEAAKRALAHAGREADEMRLELVDAGHILLGILQERDSTAGRILTDAGLTLESGRRHVEALLAARPSPLAGSAPPMQKLLCFLEAVEERDYAYRLTHPLGNAIRVELTRGDERWEIDFGAAGEVDVRVFTTERAFEGEETLRRLFESDR